MRASSRNRPVDVTGRVDVAVIGGGPAGSVAAHELARRGAAVVLFEKEAPPRYKACGGGVVARAARLLSFPIDDAVEVDCREAHLHFRGAEHPFVVRRAEPIVRMTMRARFDHLLLAQAERAGARVEAPCRVVGLEVLGDRVRVDTARGAFTVRFALIAAGAACRLGTSGAGNRIEAPRGAGGVRPIPALEWEVALRGGVPAPLRHVARFDFGALVRGYAWVFPKREHVSVGLLSSAGGAKDLEGALARYLESTGLESTGVASIERHGFVIAARPRLRELACGRLLRAGDAAGLVDPLTCEGITGAIQSGQLAAAAIVEGGFEPRRVEGLYRRSVARQILGELRAAQWLARLVYGHPRMRDWLFRRHGQRFCEAVADVVMGKVTYRGLLGSRRSWAALLFGGARTQLRPRLVTRSSSARGSPR